MSLSVTLHVLNTHEQIGATSGRPAHPRASFYITSDEIIEQMRHDELETHQVPRPFCFYEDDEVHNTNARGEALSYTYASVLRTLVVSENVSMFDRGALAFISELPDDWIIILDWR